VRRPAGEGAWVSSGGAGRRRGERWTHVCAEDEEAEGKARVEEDAQARMPLVVRIERRRDDRADLERGERVEEALQGCEGRSAMQSRSSTGRLPISNAVIAARRRTRRGRANAPT